jgi:hypothetical protein
MQEIAIKSKIITALAYDDSCGKLQIIFKNCEMRLFKAVPPHVVAELISAPSPGQYYIDHIRKSFARLTG